MHLTKSGLHRLTDRVERLLDLLAEIAIEALSRHDS
jgi:hypothetical protein